VQRRASRPEIVVAALALAASTADAEDAQYRLAGVIQLGEREVALLALPDATQVAVEVGGVVGDSTVTAVDRRSITLERGGERLVLTLAGVPTPSMLAVPAAPPQVLSRQVSASALERLAALNAAEASTDVEVGSALNELLGLPLSTQAAPADPGMARMPAVPARMLLGRLYERLASGQPVKLYLESSSADEIYLLPESPGS
jgi:hypothetical protein